MTKLIIGTMDYHAMLRSSTFLGVPHLIRSVKDLETVGQRSLDFLALIHSENQFKCGARARLTTNKTHTLNYTTECLYL